jgi:hypothetical protein
MSTEQVNQDNRSDSDKSCKSDSHCSDDFKDWQKKPCPDACFNECFYNRKDGLPLGAGIIPGSGKLYEWKQDDSNFEFDKNFNFNQVFKDLDVCPKAFCRYDALCIKECCEFAAAAHLNFINGDLIIQSPALPTPGSSCDLLQQATNVTFQDAIDIFPNLLGVNGNIYIVGTSYRKITGFNKLRFVTGRIFIADNANLIHIPTFPSLLTVSSKVNQSQLFFGIIPTPPATVFQGHDLDTLACNDGTNTNAILNSNNVVIGSGTQLFTGSIAGTGIITVTVPAGITFTVGEHFTSGSTQIVYTVVTAGGSGVATVTPVPAGATDVGPFYTIHDLDSAECASGAIIIVNNNSLRKIVGFEALRQAKDGIVIALNGCLTHICGFIHLYRTDRIVIYKNPNLSKIIGFCYIDAINVGLFILSNGGSCGNGTNCFLEINAFNNLETSIDVVVIGNKNLKELKFPKLNVTGQFVIRSNPALETIDSGSKFVFALVIERNKVLKNIKFSNLVEINQGLSISKNDGLERIDDFNELKRVGKAILIAENKSLKEIKGFDKLKYIGSDCVQNCDRVVTFIPADSAGNPAKYEVTFTCPPDPTVCDCCDIVITIPNPTINCASGQKVIDTYDDRTFDNTGDSCPYRLAFDFFTCICEIKPGCNEAPVTSSGTFDQDAAKQILDIVSYSLIIYGNPSLRFIDAFNHVKHVESNIYIVCNTFLCEIKAFACLHYVLDLWIRNNPNLKYIFGFNRLLSARDVVETESVCLVKWEGLEHLEYAQNVALEAKTAKSIELPKCLLPSVFGYISYYGCDKGRCDSPCRSPKKSPKN